MAKVWNAVLVLLAMGSFFIIRNFQANQKKKKAADAAAIPHLAATNKPKSVAAKVAETLGDPFTGSPEDLKELINDPCFAAMSELEKEDLLEKWSKLSRQEMELPSPNELKANKVAYNKQLMELLHTRKRGGLDARTAAMLDRKEAELREGLRLLEELQDEMMMEIVMKAAVKARAAKTGAQALFCPVCPTPGSKKGKKKRS